MGQGSPYPLAALENKAVEWSILLLYFLRIYLLYFLFLISLDATKCTLSWLVKISLFWQKKVTIFRIPGKMAIYFMFSKPYKVYSCPVKTHHFRNACSFEVSTICFTVIVGVLFHFTNVSHVIIYNIQFNINIKSEMRSFKSNENIHKKEGGSYYVVSANKASSVTL